MKIWDDCKEHVKKEYPVIADDIAKTEKETKTITEQENRRKTDEKTSKNDGILAIPPGATIKEQLQDRGISVDNFAKQMHMSDEQVHNLLTGEIELTESIATKLESALEIPAKFWNKLEANYRAKLDTPELKNDSSREGIRHNFVNALEQSYQRDETLEDREL